MSCGKPNPLSKLSAMFPTLIVPLGNHENMRDYIDVIVSLTQKVVKELPKPAPYQVSDTLFNMKNIVDSQELQIQRNMIAEEEPQPEPQEEPVKTVFLMKDEAVKAQDIWWTDHEDSENKDYLQFLN